MYEIFKYKIVEDGFIIEVKCVEFFGVFCFILLMLF